jgi:hypothetical protein
MGVVTSQLAYADDNRVCVVAVTNSSSDVATQVKRCKADDVLSFIVITADDRYYPSTLVDTLCRFDRQILFIPDTKAASCVYRGAARSIDRPP